MAHRASATVVAVLVAISALASEASSSPPALAVDCAYVKTGPPGPRGNLLRISDRSRNGTRIERRGAEIVVRKTFRRVDCEGRSATVRNLDRIVYVDRTPSAGPGPSFRGVLAPGATKEPGRGSEIEVSVRKSRALHLRATDGQEQIVVGRVNRRTLGVNLNSDLDGRSQDADVTMRADRVRLVRILGLDGSDRIRNRGGFGTHRAVLSFMGNRGDDFLQGGAGQQKLSGGPGDDQAWGGPGRDTVHVGFGADLGVGGDGPDMIQNAFKTPTASDPEPDRIHGKAGADFIDVATGNGLTDMVDCGPGDDRAEVDPTDHAENCEQVEVVD